MTELPQVSPSLDRARLQQIFFQLLQFAQVGSVVGQAASSETTRYYPFPPGAGVYAVFITTSDRGLTNCLVRMQNEVGQISLNLESTQNNVSRITFIDAQGSQQSVEFHSAQNPDNSQITEYIEQLGPILTNELEDLYRKRVLIRERVSTIASLGQIT